jgi:SH3 domain-containing YSC84-like protein 1
MRTPSHFATMFVLGFSWCCLTAASAQGLQLQTAEFQTREAAIVDSACQVLNEIMAIPARGIPISLLADAQGIVIVPDLLKGGFVVGVRHGRGVIVVRDDSGKWRPPTFITITGGSVGWQVGVQAADLVLVFKTKTSVESLMRGKFTIGGNLAAAAGPVGRQAEAGTDARLKAEIFSYSRSRGLFAGVALDGSVIQVDTRSNTAYYGIAPAGQPQTLPSSAARLMQEIARYAPAADAGTGVAALPASNNAADVQSAQRELADSWQRLAAILHDDWKQYLALPAEVYPTDRLRPAESLRQSLSRFDRVATNPQYKVLVQKPEFQQTYALLKKLDAQQTPVMPLTLPPPPSDQD